MFLPDDETPFEQAATARVERRGADHLADLIPDELGDELGDELKAQAIDALSELPDEVKDYF
jgi:hypothetical protein